MSSEALSIQEVREGARRTVNRVTVVGLVVNLLLSGCKLLVGVVASSHACIADAAHSLSDLATDIALLVGVRFWSAPADESHPHGHERIETLVVCFVGLALAVTGCTIGWQAIVGMARGEGHLPGGAVLLIAVVSIVSKEALYRWTARVGTRIHSAAMVANAWHHRSDALSSIPVALAAILARFFPGLTFVDQLAAVVVSAMLVKGAFDIVWPALLELADSAADSAIEEQIMVQARAVPGVREVHGLRTRRTGPGYHVDLHVLVDAGMSVKDGHDICSAVKYHLLDNGPRIIDVLVHLEPFAGK